VYSRRKVRQGLKTINKKQHVDICDSGRVVNDRSTVVIGRQSFGRIASLIYRVVSRPDPKHTLKERA
jgi:hypothetical protein